MNLYSRKELTVVAYAAGVLTGMIVAFASCSPSSEPESNFHTVTIHR